MIFVDHRIAKFVFLVAEFQDRARERCSLRKAQKAAKRTCRAVTDDNFQRNDLYFLDQHFTVIQGLDVMGNNAPRLKHLENFRRDFVINDALLVYGPLLGGIERGRVILEILDDKIGIVRRIKNFGFAFVDFVALFHYLIPTCLKMRSR